MNKRIATESGIGVLAVILSGIYTVQITDSELIRFTVPAVTGILASALIYFRTQRNR